MNVGLTLNKNFAAVSNIRYKLNLSRYSGDIHRPSKLVMYKFHMLSVKNFQVLTLNLKTPSWLGIVQKKKKEKKYYGPISVSNISQSVQSIYPNIQKKQIFDPFMSSGLFYHNSLDPSISNSRVSG